MTEGVDFCPPTSPGAQVTGRWDVPVCEEPEVRFVEENDAPIERSGTATITFLRPWLYSLSRPTNINARDLPDAYGALINKC